MHFFMLFATFGLGKNMNMMKIYENDLNEPLKHHASTCFHALRSAWACSSRC